MKKSLFIMKTTITHKNIITQIPPMKNTITQMVVLTGNLTQRSASITTILLIVEMILVANIMIFSQLHADFTILKILLLPENAVHVEEVPPEITLNQVNNQHGPNQKISRETETEKEDGTNQWDPCLQRSETP